MAWTYILRCADDTLYVGWTQDLVLRLFTHFKAPQVKWLQLHPPQEIIAAIKCDDKTMERHESLRLMEEFGWERVRGGPWTSPDLKKRPAALAQFFPDETEHHQASSAWLDSIMRRIQSWGDWSPLDYHVSSK